MQPLATSLAGSNTDRSLEAVSRASGYRDHGRPGSRGLSARTASEEEATRRALDRLDSWIQSGERPRADSLPGTYLNIRI
jgi:hypothetical protein